MFSETFTATFMQDFKAILAKQSDLLANLNALLSHYYFVATTQLILSLDKKAAFNPHQFTKVVYLLTTEKASQSRDSYLFGMKDISKKLKYTITHDHILYILNTNNFSTLSETQTYWDYLDFKNYFKDQGPQVEAEFVVSVMAWLRDYYCVKNKIAYTAAHANVETFSECIAYMHDMIQYSWSTDPTNRTKPDAVHSRYPKNYTDFQKAFFRKNAGSLGQLIALPQNYLLLLTGLSVGEEPLLVSDLWLELEKRGVWLDYQSKNEVVNLLTKLNYIDKKSDSGDAQYVKRIL
ncbi:DNA phosphorothioation-dependent restriction protein DptG [Brochothrix campestris]|uniref:Dnd system-associated protein 1 n=1 Tax=Brochothrix campestris FSL F6-1037 TaxID=1265861 RepID=W7CU67_9LIST|nr:DNA phosphorothioation-dependent restriction protein DptG [Brochothrix campestris]EUJ39346.1 dnd system-associated protein 1 [Brochothrix campestris FSL F6-1037]